MALSIPKLVWALIFVMAVGLGPLAGILALTVDVLGFAGRFFAERIEQVERGPIDALRSTTQFTGTPQDAGRGSTPASRIARYEICSIWHCQPRGTSEPEVARG